jgi:predicted transcriptional regulator
MFGANTLREQMTQERVIEYLINHGEKISSEIKIKGMPPMRISGILTRLANTNKVTRRQVPHNGKTVWCYRAIGTGPIEPDYVHILRNLPRHIDYGHG